MKFIVRFKGTAPNHYDAPQPRLVEGADKETAIKLATELADRDGLQINSVRRYFHTHQIPANN